MIMAPETTPLLHAALRAGVRIHRGDRMLLGQIEAMSDFFTAKL